MLRLLLDGHISPAVADQVRIHRPDCFIVPLSTWEEGQYREASDPDILLAARRWGLSLVTYDLATIPDLLESWSLFGIAHAGVILVSPRTIDQRNIGAQVKALIALWDRRKDEDWTNAVDHLNPVGSE